ncbi:MAG: hypothetical protein JJ902_23220 [Roseibium sp.]|nr:hypothetical protein [Roseibium sp.]
MGARWTSVEELAELILARAKDGRTVSLTAETAETVARTLLKTSAPGPHLQSLSFRLEAWDRSGANRIEMLAAAGSYPLIRLVYDAAVLTRPGDRLMVRQGIRVVLDSGPPDPDAPQNVVRLA